MEKEGLEGGELLMALNGRGRGRGRERRRRAKNRRQRNCLREIIESEVQEFDEVFVALGISPT